MNQLKSRLFGSPSLFPQKIDLLSNRIRFIEVDRAFYRRASFLDDRILTQDQREFWIPLAELDAIDAPALRTPGRYIFHHGHCGSTLVSRLLDAAPRILALREPAILRTLAEVCEGTNGPKSIWSPDTLGQRLDLFVKLFARTYPDDTGAVVKASSFCNDLGRLILQRDPNALAAGVFVPLETYMATMLGGANTPLELSVLSPSRLRRLNRRLGAELQVAGAGERAAMSWAAEMLALNDMAGLSGSRWIWMEFDGLLSSPLTHVGKLFSHFAIEIGSNDIASIIAGPTLKAYSKAQEYHFDRETRHELLAEYRTAHASEIAAGLKWLENAAAKNPSLTTLLDKTGKLERAGVRG